MYRRFCYDQRVRSETGAGSELLKKRSDFRRRLPNENRRKVEKTERGCESAASRLIPTKMHWISVGGDSLDSGSSSGRCTGGFQTVRSRGRRGRRRRR
ncbi:unnamed protein product [Microthlaspi erraticum]|uniref:Uncharacterized protein n=1 Tax=Microthlaspi erraticum TaxID=1685480 RepID=A0A6D2HEK7_9BRAS|nr:unnamed protein product [Microthlaspi erraticum]CAA7032523.1 unnamed protein product [Microthlaspi erraticum]